MGGRGGSGWRVRQEGVLQVHRLLCVMSLTVKLNLATESHLACLRQEVGPDYRGRHELGHGGPWRPCGYVDIHSETNGKLSEDFSQSRVSVQCSWSCIRCGLLVFSASPTVALDYWGLAAGKARSPAGFWWGVMQGTGGKWEGSRKGDSPSSRTRVSAIAVGAH